MLERTVTLSDLWIWDKHHLYQIAPRSGSLQFDFVKDWTTRYAACAINGNAGHELPWLQRASQPIDHCRIVGLHAG